MAKYKKRERITTRSLFYNKQFLSHLSSAICIFLLTSFLHYSANASIISKSVSKDSLIGLQSHSTLLIESDDLKLTSPYDITESGNPPIFSVTAIILNATCTPTFSGAIDITVDGGVLPYTYSWSNGSTVEDLVALQAGTYTVTITDANNQVLEKAFQVKKSCLELTKEVVGEPINNGDSTYTLTYKIKVYNAGDIGLTSIIIFDNLTYTFDSGTFFDQPVVISHDFVVNQEFTNEEWNLIEQYTDVLGPGGYGYMTFSVRVKPSNKDSVFTNISTFDAYDTDGMFIAGESSVATVTFSDRPEIKLTKTAQQPSFDQPWDLISYLVTVVNSGNVTLTNVTVTDPLTGMNELIPVLGVGESNVISTVYTITQLDIDSGQVTNTVSATGTFSSTIVSAFDTEEVPANQHPLISILKNKVEANYIHVGDRIHYEISVTNTGNVTLTDVLVKDSLTHLTQQISTLGVGSTITLTTVYTITQIELDAGSFTNNALASSTFSETIVTDSDSEIVPAIRQPSLSIVKTARKNTFNKVGETVLYDIVVRNTGNVTLYNVSVSDPLTGLSSIVPIIPVGGLHTVSTSYVIKRSDILAKSVSNTASASGLFYGQRLIVFDNELVISSQKAPVALDDKNTTLISLAVSGNVLSNDSDPDGDSITVTQFLISGKIYAAGSSAVINKVGTIVLNANGTYTFTPLPTYVGLVPLIRYTITDGNGNTARAVLRIRVIPLENPPQLLVNDTTICENEIAILHSASINVENPLYTWYSDSLIVNQVHSGSSFTTQRLNQTTSYYVRLGGSNILPALPVIVKKVTVFVNPLPAKPVVTVLGKSILCPGDSTTLVSSNAFAYQWYKNNVLIPGAIQQTIIVKDSGAYTVRTSGSNGCMSLQSEAKNITVSVLPVKPTILTSKPVYCSGDTAILTSSTSPINYWYRDDVKLLSDSGKLIKTTIPGNYTVINKNQNGCFSSISSSVTVAFNDVPTKPNVIIDGPVIFCEGDYRILKTTIPAGATVQWYKDGVLIDGKTKDTLRITVGGKYTARFTNASGCISPFSDCVCTEIKCETDIYTPDIFTPNDDDINDLISPSIPGIRKFVCFKVYNRWGNLVFYTTDPYKGWDGKYKGANQPAETYMWIVEGFDSSGKKIKKTGMLSLMR